MNYFFLVIVLSIVLVIFNTYTHSLFAEQQILKNSSNYQLSLNFSSEQEKESFLQKWLNFSPSKEIKEVPKTQTTLAIYTLNDLEPIPKLSSYKLLCCLLVAQDQDSSCPSFHIL